MSIICRWRHRASYLLNSFQRIGSNWCLPRTALRRQRIGCVSCRTQQRHRSRCRLPGTRARQLTYRQRCADPQNFDAEIHVGAAVLSAVKTLPYVLTWTCDSRRFNGGSTESVLRPSKIHVRDELRIRRQPAILLSCTLLHQSPTGLRVFGFNGNSAEWKTVTRGWLGDGNVEGRRGNWKISRDYRGSV